MSLIPPQLVTILMAPRHEGSADHPRRRSTDLDPSPSGSDLPGWANTVLKVGAVTLIALYLVQVLVKLSTGDVREIKDTLVAHVSAEAASQNTLRQELEQSIRDQYDFSQTMLALLERVCLNTANDGVERQACLNPKPLPFRQAK